MLSILPNQPLVPCMIVTLPGVIKQLTSLKPNKASGPDQIPSWFLKVYAHEIGPILTLITLLILVLYHPGGNMLLCAEFLRMAISQTVVIIDLYHYLVLRLKFVSILFISTS